MANGKISKWLKERKSFVRIVIAVVVLGGGVWIFWLAIKPDVGPGFVRESSQKLKTVTNDEEESSKMNSNVQAIEGQFSPNFSRSKTVRASHSTSKNRTRIKRAKRFKYRAKQLILRQNVLDAVDGLATSTNLIGKLLVSIDTRDSDNSIRVTLPYGSDNGPDAVIPKKSVLVGKYIYHGGERVKLRFRKCIFPNGKEYQISAQALDSSDYKSGIIGNGHSNTVPRLAKTLGLSMVSGMAEVLTDKVVMGDGYAVTARPTVKNALSQGVSKASNVELERQIQKMNGDVEEYMTVESGREVIISLTNFFRREAVEQK